MGPAPALEQAERSTKRLELALDIAEVLVYEVNFRTRTLRIDGAADTFFGGAALMHQHRMGQVAACAADDLGRHQAGHLVGQHIRPALAQFAHDVAFRHDARHALAIR